MEANIFEKVTAIQFRLSSFWIDCLQYTDTQISLKVVIPVIIIDQWNYTARLYVIQETVICSRYYDVRVSCKEGYL